MKEGNEPNKCVICDYKTSTKGDYSFSKKGNLTRHIESVHEEKKPQVLNL